MAVFSAQQASQSWHLCFLPPVPKRDTLGDDRSEIVPRAGTRPLRLSLLPLLSSSPTCPLPPAPPPHTRAVQYVRDFLSGPMGQVFPQTKFFDVKLDEDSAVLAQGCTAAIAFVNDDVSKEVRPTHTADGQQP